MRTFNKMLCASVVMLFAGIMSVNAQSYDDIYYNPKKAKKTTSTNERVAKHTTSNAQTQYIISQPQEATIYYKDLSGGSEIVNGRDVDEYNRRYNSNNTDYEWSVNDSIAMAREDLANYSNQDDYQYSRRIQKFYNPTIIIESNQAADALELGYALGSLSSCLPSYNSWYWNNWGWNSWGPSWSWNWGWNSWGPSWSWNWGWNSWGPSWSWNWGWNSWGPSWGPSWGWNWGWNSWGPSWGPSWGWGHGPSWGWNPAPAPNRPPHFGHRPGYNQNGRLPFGGNRRQSVATTPLGNRRPSAGNVHNTQIGTTRPGYATGNRVQSGQVQSTVSRVPQTGTSSRPQTGTTQHMAPNSRHNSSSSQSKYQSSDSREEKQQTTRSYNNNYNNSYNNNSSRRSSGSSFGSGSGSSRGSFGGGSFGGGSRGGSSGGGSRRR